MADEPNVAGYDAGYEAIIAELEKRIRDLEADRTRLDWHYRDMGYFGRGAMSIAYSRDDTDAAMASDKDG